MIFLAHRGLWKKKSDHNSMRAFRDSFTKGFGVETDIRDYKGRLVISHDVPHRDCLHLEDFFEAYLQKGNNVPLALNIKADGLARLVKDMVEEYEIQNYFAFDMSNPDALNYKKEGLSFFSRHSDIEKEVVLYDDAQGVWLDSFYSDWVDQSTIKKHLDANKTVSIVSPELHGRDPTKFWNKLRKSSVWDHQNLMLCTDLPQKAEKVFS